MNKTTDVIDAVQNAKSSGFKDPQVVALANIIECSLGSVIEKFRTELHKELTAQTRWNVGLVIVAMLATFTVAKYIIS
ncbi:MAG: hypothetical protein OXC41_09870 [Gammaproteobacteria bacterium]|nr:hypothetical protein [Gammaproteobacteria bacterium]